MITIARVLEIKQRDFAVAHTDKKYLEQLAEIFPQKNPTIVPRVGGPTCLRLSYTNICVDMYWLVCYVGNEQQNQVIDFINRTPGFHILDDTVDSDTISVDFELPTNVEGMFWIPITPTSNTQLTHRTITL